ncbi:MAG TPA: hypothetical protein VFY93_11375 [Planctomycetota bacterium]|nr:hypothetical protein [Planctomycetota bacterium]
MPFFDPGILRLLGFVLLFLLVAPLFPFIHVVLTWRSDARGRVDGTGTFAALLYFRTASALLALAGAANLTYGWISTTPATPELTRLSWGMLLGSIAFLLLNVVLIRARFPSHPAHARTARAFTGFLMVMAGLVALTTLVLLSIALFRKAASEKDIAQRADELKLYGAWALYYVAAYVASTWWLSRGARGEAA